MRTQGYIPMSELQQQAYEQQAKALAAAQASAHLQQAQYGGGLSGLMQGQCGVASQSPKPVEREIPAKMNRLFERVDVLSSNFAQFAGRLDSVLVPRPTDSGHDTKGCAGAPSATALGDQLAHLAARLEMLIDAVAALDAQLEL